MQDSPQIVPPYAGQNQPREIVVPKTIGYREGEREESCWVIPPYAAIFPEVVGPEGGGVDYLPPPIQKTDLWSAMQEWPL